MVGVVGVQPVLSLCLPATMITAIILPASLLLSLTAAQYASCPEPYGLQVYPHGQYCDKFYKCANGKLSSRERLCNRFERKYIEPGLT